VIAQNQSRIIKYEVEHQFLFQGGIFHAGICHAEVSNEKVTASHVTISDD